MSVASHATRGPPAPASPAGPPSFAQHRRRPAAQSAVSTPTVAEHQTQPGPIHLPRTNFPLLHSLLDSPEYRDALQKHPELHHRPTMRSSTHVPVEAKQSRRKPPKRTASELWSKVPRALGTASSVAGSLRSSAVGRQRRPKQSAEWEVVDGVDGVETLQDGVWTNSVGRSKAQLPLSASIPNAAPAVEHVTNRTTQSPRLASSLPAATLPARPKQAPPLASRPPAVESARPPLAAQSLSDLAQSASVTRAPPTSPLTYPSRPLDDQTQDGLPSGRSASTKFRSAVSQLKRMLARTTSPSSRQPRSSLSPSLRSDSDFSANTIFGGGGERSRATSGLSVSAVSLEGGFVDLGADHVPASPDSHDTTLRFSPHARSRAQSWFVSATGEPAPSSAPSAASASTLPRPHPPGHSSLLAQSSLSSSHPAPASAHPCAMSPLQAAPQRALSPRPAGRLTSASPLSTSRRTEELEAWRESRRMFLQVLRNGPAGATSAPSPAPSLVAVRQVAQAQASPLSPLRGRSVRWRAALLGRGGAERGRVREGDAAAPGPAATRRPSRSRAPRPASSTTFSTRSRSRGSVATVGEARYWSASPTASASPYESPSPNPLTRTRTIDELHGLQAGYWAYGSRWEGAEVSPESGRRSLSTWRAVLDDEEGGGEEDEKVWSKWRGWVRERRNAIRRER